MKKMMKYQLKDLLLGYFVYALIMILLTAVVSVISINYSNVNVSVNGNGFSSVIFCFVVTISIYKEHCQLAIQNSISRKDFFRSTICVITIISFMCALLDVLLRVISQVSLFSAGTNNFSLSSFVFLFYPKFLERSNEAFVIAVGFFMSFFICLMFAVLGLLIAGIYLRLPKKFRTVYCVALPIAFCGLLPGISAIAFFSPGPVRRFAEFLLKIMNTLDIMGTASGSPFRGMLTFTVVSVIMTGICYRILRKTDMV